MSQHYISNPLVFLEKDFIFTFDVEGEKHRDFLIKFNVLNDKSNGFVVSNVINGYRTKESSEYVKKSVNDFSEVINFFGDELIVVNNIVYKSYNNESADEIKDYIRKDNKLFIKSDLYSIDDSYIIRKNPQIDNDTYLRPVIVKTLQNGSTISKKTIYFDTLENPVNSNKTKTYRIIVSDKSCLISFWVKENNSFRLIKNFTYPATQEISEGKISLEIDSDMKLANLHFSFFEA